MLREANLSVPSLEQQSRRWPHQPIQLAISASVVVAVETPHHARPRHQNLVLGTMSPHCHSYRRLRSRPLRRRTHRYSRRQCVTLPKTVTQQYVVPTYHPMVSADLAEYSAEDIATYFAMVHRLGSTSGTALGYIGQARQERMDRQSFQIPNIQAPWVTSLIKSPPPVPRASPYQVAPAEPPIKAALQDPNAHLC